MSGSDAREMNDAWKNSCGDDRDRLSVIACGARRRRPRSHVAYDEAGRTPSWHVDLQSDVKLDRPGWQARQSGIAARRARGDRHGLYEMQGHLPDDRGGYGRDRGSREGFFPERRSLRLLLAGFGGGYARTAEGLRRGPRARPWRLGAVQWRRQGRAGACRGARRALPPRRQRRLRPLGRHHHSGCAGAHLCAATRRDRQYRGDGQEAVDAVQHAVAIDARSRRLLNFSPLLAPEVEPSSTSSKLYTSPSSAGLMLAKMR